MTMEPDTAGVNPVTLAGLRCEIRDGFHRPGVACGPILDRMIQIAYRLREPDPLDVGARVFVAQMMANEPRALALHQKGKPRG